MKHCTVAMLLLPAATTKHQPSQQLENSTRNNKAGLEMRFKTQWFLLSHSYFLSLFFNKLYPGWLLLRPWVRSPGCGAVSVMRHEEAPNAETANRKGNWPKKKTPTNQTLTAENSGYRGRSCYLPGGSLR